MVLSLFRWVVNQRCYRRRRSIARGLGPQLDKSRASNPPRRFTGGRVITWLRDGSAGNAIVELALTLPLLAWVLMGLFKTGMAFNNYLILQNAVSQGTYAVANNASAPTTTDPCMLAYTAVSSVTPQFNQAKVDYAIKLNGSSTWITGSGSFSCDFKTMSIKSVVADDPVVLRVSYPVDMNIMGVDLMPGGIKMSATAQQNVQVFLQ